MPKLTDSGKIVHAFSVPFRGVWRQLPPYLTPPDALWDAANVVVRDGVLQPRDGHDNFVSGDVFTGTPIGMSVYQTTAGATVPICATREKIYKYESAAWTEISGTTLSAGPSGQARFTSLVVDDVNYIVHVNGANAPRRWNGTGNFATLAGSPGTWSDVTTIADRLVGVIPPYDLRWYNARSITVRPAANSKQLAETPDRIVAVSTVGQVAGVAWKEDSLWSITPTGSLSDAQSFRFDLVGFYEGPAGPAAIVDVNGLKAFMTPTGRIGVFSGTRVTWVADGIWPLIRADIITTSSRRVFGWYNPILDEVWFCYPSTTWGNLKGLVILTPPKPEAGVTAWGAFPGGFGNDSLRCAVSLQWDDGTRDVLLGTGSLESHKITGATDNGTAIPGYWRPGLFHLDTMDPMRLEAMEVFATRGAGQGTLTIQPYTSWTLADDGVASPTTYAVDLEAAETPRALTGLDERGRFFGFKASFTSAAATPVRYKAASLFAQKKVT